MICLVSISRAPKPKSSFTEKDAMLQKHKSTWPTVVNVHECIAVLEKLLPIREEKLTEPHRSRGFEAMQPCSIISKSGR